MQLTCDPATQRTTHDLLKLVRIARTSHHRILQLLDDLMTDLVEFAFVFGNRVEIDLRTCDNVSGFRIDNDEARHETFRA